MKLSHRVFGVGVMALGAEWFASHEFVCGQPLPEGFPQPIAVAYAAAVFTLAAGAAIVWRRATACGAACLSGFYAIIVVPLIGGSFVLAQFAAYGTYSGVIAEQLAILAAALIVYAATSKIDAAWAARLIRVGQIMFGACAVLFGGAHFVYPDLTIPLVPRFLPPSQAFWAYATGIAHIAAGAAIITGVQARLAAILLTAMYAAFTPLVHLPMFIADPASHDNWNENAVNLALTGAAWVVADSWNRRRATV